MSDWNSGGFPKFLDSVFLSKQFNPESTGIPRIYWSVCSIDEGLSYLDEFYNIAS